MTRTFGDAEAYDPAGASDAYTDGLTQGEGDRMTGCEYAPESDDEEYLHGYEDGWDSAGDPEEDEDDE